MRTLQFSPTASWYSLVMRKLIAFLLIAFAIPCRADEATQKAAEDAGQKIQTHARKAGEGLQHAADSTKTHSKTKRRPFLSSEDLHKDRSKQGAGESPMKNTEKSGKKKGSLMDELHKVRG
ncbi:MAG: hypothetical protein JO102_03135 [Elusimicrobia bacterium]|nr:hypothetical protein [Elusimicrobiota bacterium]